jgi:hypothetical protein
VVTRSYVVGLPVVVTVEDGPPWENSPRVTYEVDTSEAGREVDRSDETPYSPAEVAQDVAVIEADHANRVKLRRPMAERTENIVLAESKIGRLIGALQENGWQPSWYNTGGGCMVVYVPLTDERSLDHSGVLIGEGGPPHGPDAFGWTDLESDENVTGIWFASLEDEKGEPVERPLVMAGTTEDVVAAIRPLRKHEARPDDDPEPGDRCKDCGRPVVWIGPSQYDWEHSPEFCPLPCLGVGVLHPPHPGEDVWDTETLKIDFDVLGFQAPFVVVRKKRTGEKGSLQFDHAPRVYFGWKADDE